MALVTTPVVIWLAHRIGAVDEPGLRKVHKDAVPRIGGIVLFISTLGPMLAVLSLQNRIGDAFRAILPKVVTLLAASSFMFLIGLIDDIRGMRARKKFLAQTAAALAVCAVGVRIELVGVGDWLTLEFGWFSWPLTLLWIVGITNAVNLSDGLDGLAAGIAAVACGVIVMLAIWTGQVVMAILALSLLGSLTGFIYFNFNPAKIFLGDSGSMFLGFTIAASSVLFSTKSQALVGLALPALALGIPIFDTLFSMLRRFLERRSLFAPDQSHFHHRLLALGLKQRHAVIVAYALTCIIAGLGLFMMATRGIESMFLLACILLLLLLVFRAVGSVRLRETIAGLQRKHAVARSADEEKRRFEEAQLRFHHVDTFEDWWEAACAAGECMDFAWISLKTAEEDSTITTSVWRRPDFDPDLSRVMVMTLPIKPGLIRGLMEFEVAVMVDGSFESAGRRASFFGRLIDEYAPGRVGE
jgi:UDP-GlcNAc:undecaprenyl-phosphate GlcNAc-1-phosphate transferase